MAGSEEGIPPQALCVSSAQPPPQSSSVWCAGGPATLETCHSSGITVTTCTPAKALDLSKGGVPGLCCLLPELTMGGAGTEAEGWDRLVGTLPSHGITRAGRIAMPMRSHIPEESSDVSFPPTPPHSALTPKADTSQTPLAFPCPIPFTSSLCAPFLSGLLLNETLSKPGRPG